MFLIVVGLAIFVAQSQRYEAEEGTLLPPANGTDQIPVVFTNETEEAETSFSGTGYVDLKEGGIRFAVTVNPGFYVLYVGTKCDDDGREQYLSVNGKSAGKIATYTTTGFERRVAVKKLNLKAQSANTIEIIAYWGYQLFDYIELVPYVDTTPFNIKSNLVSPNPIPHAVELYNFLKNNFGKKIISGAMTLQGGEEFSQREQKWIYENTGKYPALLGLDFMRATGLGEEWWYNDSCLSKEVVRDASDYYCRGGIVALMWHWRDPSRATNSFYSPSTENEPTNFNATKAADTTTTEYGQIIADLDVVAAHLLELQNKGIAVLWRPFHEAAGRWFWWGYEGPEALKKLWKIMYDRFTINHNLSNLIWVWTSNGGNDALAWYPGDEYVDIVGLDSYPAVGDHSSQVGLFESLKEIFEGKKILALAECGSIPDPEFAVDDEAYWSYFMPWYGDYTIPGGDTTYNNATFWQTAMNNAAVLNLNSLPGWTTNEAAECPDKSSTDEVIKCCPDGNSRNEDGECIPDNNSASSSSLKFFYIFSLLVLLLFI